MHSQTSRRMPLLCTLMGVGFFVPKHQRRWRMEKEVKPLFHRYPSLVEPLREDDAGDINLVLHDQGGAQMRALFALAQQLEQRRRVLAKREHFRFP